MILYFLVEDAEIKTKILEEDDARQKLDFDTKSANGVNEDSDKVCIY